MLYRVVDKFGNWVATGMPKRCRTYQSYSTALGVATRFTNEYEEYRVQQTQIHWEDVNE